MTTLQFLLGPHRLGPGDVLPRAPQEQAQLPVEGPLLGRVAAALQGVAIAGGRAGAPIGTSHGSSSLSIFQGHYTPVPETVDRLDSFYVLVFDKAMFSLAIL
jgi:hypothetical protein